MNFRFRHAALLVLAGLVAGCGSDTTVTIVYTSATFPVTVDADVKYGEGETLSGPNVNLLMDVYSPEDGQDGPRPAMIIAHGGAWIIGGKKQTEIVDLANFYAARGFVTFAINYRMVGDDPAAAPQWWADTAGEFLDEPTTRASHAAIVDTATAVRFVRANAEALGVDSGHIFGIGASAGAFNVVHVGLDDPALFASELAINHPEESSSLQLVIDNWGGCFHRSEVDADDPPVLIFHGTEDSTVPFDLGQRLDESLTAAGVPHQFVPLEGAGHSAWDAIVEAQTLNEISMEFIAMHGGIPVEPMAAVSP